MKPAPSKHQIVPLLKTLINFILKKKTDFNDNDHIDVVCNPPIGPMLHVDSIPDKRHSDTTTNIPEPVTSHIQAIDKVFGLFKIKR